MMVEYVYKTKEGEEEMNSKNCIKKVHAIQVYTRRHVLGIKAFVETEGGAKGQAECSAGVSIGSHEVHFESDGGTRWGGKGCTKAVNSINTVINDTLRGMDVTNQYELDRAMLQIGGDGKNAVGGNAIAAVSAACLKAGAAALEIPLYRYIGGERACMLPVPGAPAYSGGERWGGGVHPTGNKPTTAFQCYDFGSFAEASHSLFSASALQNSMQGGKYIGYGKKKCLKGIFLRQMHFSLKFKKESLKTLMREFLS